MPEKASDGPHRELVAMPGLKSELPDFVFLQSSSFFIYLWLHWAFVTAQGLSLVAMSWDYFCLWRAGAPSISEHRLSGRGLPWLWLTGFVAPRHVQCSRTGDRTCVPCISK